MMSPSRYEILQDVKPDATTHAGLWLDKFLKGTGNDAKKNLVKDVAQTIRLPDEYKHFYTRWKTALEESGAVCKNAKVMGRLAIDLGAESVLETSIALHHTYGTPYIPGSAIKGLAAHYAPKHLDASEWGKKSQAFRILFGDTKSAGYITFFDALYIPGTGHEGKALWPDVITVHHPDYYQTGNTPPADWDNPTPIPFLTATGSFLIALAGRADWVNATFDILALALENEGIGAKTSSGYGRMKLSGSQSVDELPVQKESTSIQGTLPPGYQRGVVKNFLDTYGFIQPDAGGKDVFVHISGLAQGVSVLQPRQRVIYKPGPGKKPGQVQANDVRPEN